MEQRDPRFDVAVIGAGQAGLAIGHLLGRRGRRFVILEAAGSRMLSFVVDEHGS